MRKVLNWLSFLLPLAGIFIAGTLSLGHYLSVSLPCGPHGGCDAVTNDPSSKWFGVPVAYIGLGAYVVLALLGLFRAVKGFNNAKWTVGMSLLVSGIGTLISFGLTAYALIFIQQTCLWCISSAITMILITVTNAVLYQSDETQMPSAKLDLPVYGVCAVLAMAMLGMQVSNLKKDADTLPIQKEILDKLTPESMVPADARIYGEKDAPLTVVEFMDMLCPSCRANFPYLKDLVRSHPKIRSVYRHFPIRGLAGHEMSLPLAVVSEFAREKGKFWPFVDAVMAVPADRIKRFEDVLGIAESIGLNADEVSEYVNKGVPDAIMVDINKGNELGIESTPTFFVFCPDLPPTGAVAGYIQQLLGRPKYAKYMQ